jgi:Tol biopolymer transport system component
MGGDGGNAKKLLQAGAGDRFLAIQWSPDGERIAYLKSHIEGDRRETAIESIPAVGGVSSTILSAPGLQSFCWSPDGRIIYSMEEPPPNDRATNLWELAVGRSGAKSDRNPQRITNWAGMSLSDLSISRDSRHLVFVNAGVENDLYVAALQGKGSMEPPRRFTLEGRDNLPSTWAADGHTLFFYSDRNGNWDIFRQSLGERNAQDFVVGHGQQTQPIVSPDGSWILYWDWGDKESQATGKRRLLRVPISGGAPQQVLEASQGAAIRCVPGQLPCLLSEDDGVNHELVFTAVDPIRGRQDERIRLAADPAESPAWDLSPDGSAVAIVDLDSHKNDIRLAVLESGSIRLITLDSGERLSGIARASDNGGWFVTSSSVRGSAIFYVSASGAVSKLWTTSSILGAPLASRDGKQLAFTISRFDSNAWLLEDF